MYGDPALSETGASLLAHVEARLLVVNEARARLAAQAMALRTARLRLSVGVDPKIVTAELDVDPSQPLETSHRER